MSTPHDHLAMPVPTPDSAEFWAACRQERLRMQRCLRCRRVIWFPRGMCVNCGDSDLQWEDLSGRGSVYSFSIVHRRLAPELPEVYVLALVDLAEGPRMTSWIVEVDPDDVSIGMPVTVTFLKRSDEIYLPVFRPADLPPSDER